MADGDRIAELQRLAYGAGTDDAERALAAAELDALRRDASPRGGEHGGPGPLPAGRSHQPAPAPESDPFDALGIAGEAPVPPARRVADATVRWGVVIGAIALAIGFGAGWVSGAQVTDLTGGPDEPIPDSALTFNLEPAEAVAVAFDDARAMDVFERPQVPEDVPGFSDPEFDASSYRRVGTFPDGASVHVARNADTGQVCLQLDLRDVGGMSTCTQGGMFPAEGLYVEGGFDSGFYRVEWTESGEVSFSAAPTT